MSTVMEGLRELWGEHAYTRDVLDYEGDGVTWIEVGYVSASGEHHGVGIGLTAFEALNDARREMNLPTLTESA